MNDVATLIYGEFEWDSVKAAANVEKHGVSFEEASTVILSDEVLESADAIDPSRLITIGFSSAARVLLVVSCEPGSRIRIISARPANAAERRAFARR
jgi:hypothetical protein